jgi:hypothetical protein
MAIKTQHHHNLRGTCGQSFGCLKSQLRSKLSCMAVSIPKIIGEALPYISCISRVLWRPTCFCGSCAASSEPAKYKVIKLLCQHMLDLFTWWSTTPSSLVAILVSSVYSTCAVNCHCNNSTDYSPSEGNTPSPKFPASLKVLWQYRRGLHSPEYDTLPLGTRFLMFPRNTVPSSSCAYRYVHV